MILELKNSIITTKVFASNELQQIFSTHYLPLITEQFKREGITRDDMDNVFSNGYLASNDNAQSNKGKRVSAFVPGGNPRLCECNMTSMFGCGHTCLDSGCSERASGCGFVFWFNCNGECRSNMPLGGVSGNT